QQSLLWVLALITLYFLIAFIFYASSDFIAWRLAFMRAIGKSLRKSLEREMMPASAETELENIEQSIRLSFGARVIFSLSSPVSVLRAIFEFLVPVVVGIYTIIILWTTDLPI
ncbi:MAG: hypothetical protein ACFFDT_40215, partial [Candidatus Hodarchaeota archaeon]